VQLDRSTVEERTEQKVRIYGVRIFPVLASVDVGSQLADRTLAEVCREFVFDDPQVLAVQVLLEQATNTRVGFGFAWKNFVSVWPLDLGWRLTIDSPTSDAPKKSKNLALRNFAESLIANRFSRLIDLLHRGGLTAFGIPQTGGENVEVPYSIWRRERMYLDLQNGDLIEARQQDRSSLNRSPPADHRLGLIGRSEDRSRGHKPAGLALYREIVLRRAGSSTSHVKPQFFDSVPPNTTEGRRGNKDKALSLVAERQAALEACTSWLVELMTRSPNEPTERSKSLWLEAKRKWPRLTNKNYHQARKLAVARTGAIAWSAAGAPEKK
jgi:hypothetical protein